MRRRLETFVLIVLGATVAAFAVSFVVGLRGAGGGSTDGGPFSSAGGDSARVRVEVLNGAGRQGLAERVTNRLRARGFDVVYYGNATSFDWDRSIVYARSRDTLRARAVADALGIAGVEARPAAELHLDATVVLGREWTPPATPPRSRLRDWLDGLGRWIRSLGGESGEPRR